MTDGLPSFLVLDKADLILYEAKDDEKGPGLSSTSPEIKSNNRTINKRFGFREFKFKCKGRKENAM